MGGFIKWLEELNVKDTKVKATLRRSLAFAPGTFPKAYPYVEPFVKDARSEWYREIHYIVAALWALHWREGRGTDVMRISKACAAYFDLSESKSIEQRFILLLDADMDQLPYRLRQLVALLKDYSIDLDDILEGLKYWNDEKKITQNRWAHDFYRNVNQQIYNEANFSEETAE